MPRLARSRLRGGPRRAQSLGLINFADLVHLPSDHPAPFTNQLPLAVAAYLARFIGASREHTESDLRCHLSWCAPSVAWTRWPRGGHT